jgi:hypothetical protein
VRRPSGSDGRRRVIMPNRGAAVEHSTSSRPPFPR